MADTDDAAAIARRWVEMYNDGTPTTYGSDRFLELYAEDCRWEEAPTPFSPDGRGGGLDAVREAVARGQAILVDRRAELKDVVADGDHGAMRYTWSATVNVDGFPVARGHRLTADVAAFFLVRSGRIAEIREIVAMHPG